MATLEFPDKASVPSDYNFIKVDMFEWANGGDGTILETTGLATCTGITIYDPKNKVGHLAHIPVPHEDKKTFDELLTSVLQDGVDPSTLIATVRGSALDDDPDSYPEYVRESRSYTIARLMTAGIQNPDIEWSEPDDVVDMFLDCSTGKCEVVKYSFNSLLGRTALEEDW